MTGLRVVVIGSGVVGMSTAVVLAMRGHRVRVISAGGAARTSSAAAAFWYPFRIGQYECSIAESTYAHLAKLARFPDATGVRRQRSEEYFESAALQDDADAGWWWSRFPGFDAKRLEGKLLRIAGRELPFATEFHTYVAHMGQYLQFLRKLLDRHDIVLEERRLFSIEDAFQADCDVVVNCSGIGALDLLGSEIERRDLIRADRLGVEPGRETGLVPVHGQVYRLDGQSYPDLIFVHSGAYFEKNPFYIVPRGKDVIVGGSLRRLLDYKQFECLRPRAEDATEDARIRAWCEQVAPGLRMSGAEVLTGIRPVRHALRIEYDDSWIPQGGKCVIHNYGHGGSGMTLSWGSGERVAELISHYLMGSTAWIDWDQVDLRA